MKAYQSGIDVHAPGWRLQPPEDDAKLDVEIHRKLGRILRDISSNYAIALMNVKRDDEAFFILEKVMILCEAMKHDCRIARFNIGLLQRKTSKYKNGLDMALQTYENLNKEFPDDYIYRLHIYITFQMMSRLVEAINGYEAILKDAEAGKVVSNDVLMTALGNLGAAYQESGKFDSAIYYYKQVLQRDPNDARAHNNMGSSLWQIGDAEGAINAYKKAIEADPEASEAYINMGVAYYEYGLISEAKRVYEKAYELGGNDGIRARIATMTLPIMVSQEAIAHDRRNFRRNIMSLMKAQPPLVLPDPVKDIERVHFYCVSWGKRTGESENDV